MVLLGTCTAIELEEQHHAHPLLAILLGAANGTGAVMATLELYRKIQRTIWRRTRGYPFADGDRVEVTRGPLCGARGRVVSLGQGFDVEVIFDDHSTNVSSKRLSAGKLRKVSQVAS